MLCVDLIILCKVHVAVLTTLDYYVNDEDKITYKMQRKFRNSLLSRDSVFIGMRC